MITKQGSTIGLKREVRVPVAALYQAWTDPAVFTAWWKDLKVAEMDFRVGGNYRLNWQDGASVTGTYLEIDPQTKVVMTWITDGSCSGTKSAPHESKITLSFKSIDDNRSEVELLHEGLKDSADIDTHHWGWTHALYSLDEAYNKSGAAADGTLELTKRFDAPVERVFEAWTNPEQLNQWFNRKGATLGKATCDLRVGKNLCLDYQMEDGTIWRHYCQFTEIVPNERLAFSWITDACHYETHVTVEFTALGDQTELRLKHHRFRDEVVKKEHESGWTHCLRAIGEDFSTLKFKPGLEASREATLSL